MGNLLAAPTPQPDAAPTATKSPKTTSAGVLAIAFAGLNLAGQIYGASKGLPLDTEKVVMNVASISAGVGLVSAKDSKK